MKKIYQQPMVIIAHVEPQRIMVDSPYGDKVPGDPLDPNKPGLVRGYGNLRNPNVWGDEEEDDW